MADRDSLIELHERATRGEVLSVAEHALFEAWYAEQDAVEAQSLSHAGDSDAMRQLRADLGRATRDLTAASLRVGELTKQNEGIRSEIDSLRHQLAQRSTSSA